MSPHFLCMSKRHWTQEEINLLRQYYGTADINYLRQLFPDRSYESILHIANRLRLRRTSIMPYLEERRIRDDLSIEERAYLAGLLDGEGSITVSLRRRGTKSNIMPSMSPLIIFTNSNSDLVKYVHSLIAGSTIKTVKATSIRRTVWSIQVARLNDIESLLGQLFQYLIAKKRQAQLILEYCKVRKQDTLLSYNDRLFEIAKEVRALNKKGPKMSE